MVEASVAAPRSERATIAELGPLSAGKEGSAANATTASAAQIADPAIPARTAEPASRLANAGDCRAKKPATARAAATSDDGGAKSNGGGAGKGSEPKARAPRAHADAEPKATIMASSPALAAEHQMTPARPPGATLRKTAADTMISAATRFGVTNVSVAATATSKPASAVRAAVAQAAIPETAAAGEPGKRLATMSFGAVAPNLLSKGPIPIAPIAAPAAMAGARGSGRGQRPVSRQSAIPASTAVNPRPP